MDAYPIIAERLADVTRLGAGGHDSPDHGLCVMEAVDYATGAPHSARPPCACPVIAGYAIQLNDRMPDDWRQRLIPYVARIAGTRATPDVERRRGYLAATFAVKVFAPLALDATGCGERAAMLRAVPDIAADAAAYAAHAADAAAAADLSATAFDGVWVAALACLDALLAVGAEPAPPHPSTA